MYFSKLQLAVLGVSKGDKKKRRAALRVPWWALGEGNWGVIGMEAILTWDVLLFRWVNTGFHSPTLDGLMIFASSPWTWILLALWFVVVGLLRGNRRLLLSCLSIGIAIGIVDTANYWLLKPAFGRIRPCFQLSDVRVVTGSCGGELSFPSNHAANAAAVVAAASFAQRTPLIGATLMAFLVGFSRVYLGVHFPMDVLGGWIFGGICGILIQWLLERSMQRFLS
jgi:undecaprenyl-diphosphatase